MGYDLHVHRRENWWDEHGEDITEADLEAVAGGRTDLKQVGSLSVTNPATGETITAPGPFWLWTGHPGVVEVPLALRDGRVVLKGPDDEMLAFLVELAQVIGARVQGDEGEFYPEETGT